MDSIGSFPMKNPTSCQLVSPLPLLIADRLHNGCWAHERSWRQTPGEGSAFLDVSQDSF